VLWLESEDDPHEIHARFNAIATSYDLDDTEKTAFATNVTLYAGAAVALCAPIDGTVKPTNQFRWLERTVSDLQPGLIVIDPLSHFFGGDENSNIEMAAFLNTLKGLTDLVEGGAALWINHHVSKQRENDSSSAAGRGASAFRDAIRSGFALTPPTPEDVKTFGIVTPSNFVKLTHVKSNWTAQVDAPIFLKRGHAGVLHEVDSREMRESIETAMAEQMAVAITELIGDNPDALTCNEIKGRPQGQHIRDELRDKFGKWANKQGISSALNDAVARGKLTVEVEKKDRTTRNVPRRCDDAPRYARGSAHRD
jgi:RecA-family ATPase